MKYIEYQYLNRSALIQMDSESCFNPATRTLSRCDVPYDAEDRARSQESGDRRQENDAEKGRDGETGIRAHRA